ncbi:uncharacterized protein ATC70_012008 [Mucor velutinosus]|uniref:Reverse transcriptase domain-containing protein n=2 Tax=Mucor velutinosus TaxID=708070 RepID=A0AAN7I409_9FUNG|nr:hypothetical protein ATC70_012008 [Mucor velutinosus]
MTHYATNPPMTDYRSTIKIGSLNCRSLSKLSNPTTSSEFVRFLRNPELKYDILCFQETHATESVRERLNMQFQTNTSIWTSHCGIVSLNPKIIIQPLNVTLDDRIIVCQVTHCNALFSPITLVNIYAPATASSRAHFYSQLLTIPLFHPDTWALDTFPITIDIQPPPISTEEPSTIAVDRESLIILGDFNYHATSYAIDNTNYTTDSFSPPIQSDQPHHHSAMLAQHRWHDLLSNHLIECTRSKHDGPLLPTFRRGTSRSTIDYVYCSPTLFQQLHSSSIDFMCSQWTDHAILNTTFQFSSSQQGTGLWRANPQLAKNEYFVTEIHQALDQFFQEPGTSPQAQWDALKAVVKTIARRIGRRHSSWRNRQLKRFQRKRNQLFKRYQNQPAILRERLPVIEKLISDLQQEISIQQTIRAGKMWREQGETSAGYLKRTIATRQIQRTMLALQHPDTHSICDTAETMQDAAVCFYRKLYTTDSIDYTSISELCNTIPASAQIPVNSQPTLETPFTIDEIMTGAQRSPNHSSPGTDGLPYEILAVLLSHQQTAQLAHAVFKEALTLGIFPNSWLTTCMCLLPKKGDLTDLRNFRPISLINCDAKIFTRLLNQRLMPHMQQLISPQQLGFMPNRFIGEHGFTLQTTKLLATTNHSSTIALLLDQEKAYDRIHPEYLQHIMLQFGIPQSLTHCIISLFFSTNIQININGHITKAPLPQERGLRQGDPLSPLLFNIAFDPFLRSIQQNPTFEGFHVQQEAPPHPSPTADVDDLTESLTNSSPPPDSPRNTPSVSPTHRNPIKYKILAYADDTLVYLKNFSDFLLLQDSINAYMKASNALLNYRKTIAISLSGQPQPDWREFLATHQIHQMHDRTSPDPVTYLGYPICSSLSQRNLAFQQLYNNIQQCIHIHSQRNLSIRGRATVLNTLIFSKLWHVMRNFIFTKAQLLSLRSLGSSFINFRIFPKLSFRTLQQPRHHGGLQVLDPIVQQQALQWRWICPLILAACHSPLLPTYTTPSIPLLQYSLQWYFHSTAFSDYFYYLLFPAARQTIWFQHRPSPHQAFLNILTNVITTMDRIPRSFTTCHLDFHTGLSLPFLEIILHTLPSTHPHFSSFTAPDQLFDRHHAVQKLLAIDVFTFDFDLQVIRLRNWTFLEFCHYPRISHRVARWIEEGQIYLQPFFLALCRQAPRHSFTSASFGANPHNIRPLIRRLIKPITPLPSTVPLNSIQYYKHLVSTDMPTINTSPLSPSQWRLFWKLPILLQSRTVWYRLIHRKIPSKSILHHFIPTTHPSPSCPLCLTQSPEDIQHFFFTCPLKLAVWRFLATTYLSHTPMTDDVLLPFLHGIQTLSIAEPTRSASLPFPELTVYQVFATSLLCIWQAHWRSIFDHVPFVTLNVNTSIARSLSRLESELQFDL